MPPKPSRAEFYRGEAARLNRLADVATLPEVRTNLLRTARLYEAMARRVTEYECGGKTSQDSSESDPAKPARRPSDSRNRGSS